MFPPPRYLDSEDIISVAATDVVATGALDSANHFSPIDVNVCDSAW
eukprot:SAG31_NODE_23091_length_511_cov_1.912621_2_plen_46_part_00